MGLPFLLGVLVTLAAFFHLLARRIEVEGLRARLAERAAAERGADEGGRWAT